MLLHTSIWSLGGNAKHLVQRSVGESLFLVSNSTQTRVLMQATAWEPPSLTASSPQLQSSRVSIAMNTLGIGFRVSNTIRGKVRFGFPFEGTWRLSICQIVDMVKLERAPEVASADIGGFLPGSVRILSYDGVVSNRSIRIGCRTDQLTAS